MTVFLSYAREDNRLAESLAAHLNALGLSILAFEDVELIEGSLDYLKECRSICVLYSANSKITHSVRLARRMSKRSVAGLVFIDEDWDADTNSLDVFSSFLCHRSRFDYLSITKTLRAIVGLWTRTGAPSKAVEEDFHALIIDPITQSLDAGRLSARINSISGPHATVEDLIREIRAILHVDLPADAKRRAGIASLVAQLGRNQAGRSKPGQSSPDQSRVARRLWKPPGDPPDDYVLGGMRALLQAIDARQPRAIAPPAPPGASAGGAADSGGQVGGSAPPSPPNQKKD